MASFAVATTGGEVVSTPADTLVGSFQEFGFLQAFLKSVTMIVVTELGDKTFFIAAVMAMRNPRLVVYAGALGALVIMTILSTVIGYAVPLLLPKIYVHYASVLMFFFFGFKLLSEAKEMYGEKDPKKNDELEEVENELGVGSSLEEEDVEKGAAAAGEHKSIKQPEGAFQIFMLAFTLTFFAEWGDRSQIATISLASVNDPVGVTMGSIVGHAACTGLAVVGGRLLASRISERQVALAGGIVFLCFAVHSLYVGA